MDLGVAKIHFSPQKFFQRMEPSRRMVDDGGFQVRNLLCFFGAEFFQVEQPH